MKIWCVEDDESIRDIEVYTLTSADLDARGFPDGASFREALAVEKPDLIILDIMLPEESGMELLKFLKAGPDTCRIPVIMATAKGMEYDKILSLDQGADDHLVKPFGMMEMVSRVKAVLRRCSRTEGPRVLKTGGLVVDLDAHTVTLDNERIQLTLKEFELLRVFLSHPNIAFTRDQLFNIVWGDDHVGETRTVDMHIRTLRVKLRDHGKLIQTVRGIGYRAEVQV